ncbi:unnamed protein product [Ectocarpus sp. 12 AP-2014]
MRPRTSNQVRAFVDEVGIANQFPGLDEEDLGVSTLALCKPETPCSLAAAVQKARARSVHGRGGARN